MHITRGVEVNRRTRWRQGSAQERLVGIVEGIDEGYPAEHPTVLKVFAQKIAHANPIGRGPDHGVPERQAPRLATGRTVEIALTGGMNREHGAQSIEEVQRIVRPAAHLARRDRVEFGQSLEDEDASPATQGALDQARRRVVAVARALVDRIDENVGVKRDAHRSCISSRVNRLAPRTRPRFMIWTASSIAASCSGVRGGRR
jgi:hypothetical protein